MRGRPPASDRIGRNHEEERRGSGPTLLLRSREAGALQKRVQALGAREDAADERDERAAAFFGGSRRLVAAAAAAIALDGARHRILPLQLAVADDLGLAFDLRQRAAVAVGGPAAELVDGRFGIHADRFGVFANIGARENPVGPAREIVALEARPQRLADLGVALQLLK